MRKSDDVTTRHAKYAVYYTGTVGKGAVCEGECIINNVVWRTNTACSYGPVTATGPSTY